MDIRIRAVLGAACVLAAAAFLIPSPAPERHYPKRIPVRFWHMWSSEWQPVVEHICDRFNESQDRYEVMPLSVPSTGAEEKFLMSAAGGEPPDLVSQWNPVLGMWVERGLVQPVENFMTAKERADFLREAYPIMRKHAVYHGKIMAVIAGVDVDAVFYRLDHLREVGVDKDHLPQTLEELVALGQKLDRRDAQGHLKRVGFLPAYWSSFVPSFGGTFNQNGKMVFDSPQNLRALQFIVDQDKRLGFQDVIRFQSSLPADTGTTIPEIAGNYSMMLDGEWRVKSIKDYAPDLDYVIAPFPPPKGGVPRASFTAANYMLIPSAAKHPDGAMAFLKFWTGMIDAEAGGANVASMGWLPYCPRVAASRHYQEYLAKYPKYRTFVDMMSSPNLEIPPQGPLQSYVMDQLQQTDDLTSRGTLDPKQAIARLVRNVADETARQRRLGNVR